MTNTLPDIPLELTADRTIKIVSSRDIERASQLLNECLKKIKEGNFPCTIYLSDESTVVKNMVIEKLIKAGYIATAETHSEPRDQFDYLRGRTPDLHYLRIDNPHRK
jgi:hypothetical protein